MAEVLTPSMQPHSPTSHTPPPATTTSADPPPNNNNNNDSSVSSTSSSIISPQQQQTRPRPRSHFSASNSVRSMRLSTLSSSRQASSSRPQSTLHHSFAAQSSLSYATVRDFAYPLFHPLHFGPPPDSLSGTTTPGSEWNSSSRRLSDSFEAWNTSSSGSSGGGGGGDKSGGSWGVGPWGGDGTLYAHSAADDGEALPSTSFGEGTNDENNNTSQHHAFGQQPRAAKHRKSKSYTDFSDMDRGRQQQGTSGNNNNRRSRASGESNDLLLDPAGQGSLRQSRNYGSSRKSTTIKNGAIVTTAAGTLPSRSFHTSQLPEPENDEDLLPLDAEQSAHAQSPQRASMGPEDEELYAGESLALYSFEPENPNELRLREGQIILVSYRHGQGWLVAEDPETGEQGLVPEEYVRLIREIETWDPERGGFIEDDSMVADEHDVEQQQQTDEQDGFEQEKQRHLAATGEDHKTSSDTPVPDSHHETHEQDVALPTDRGIVGAASESQDNAGHQHE